MIDTRGLTKTFPRGKGEAPVLAVDHLDLSVGQGEVFGFLGPNGAGKTTTVRMLTSLIGPTAGEASVAGFRVGQDDTDIRRNVGILTESPGLYERLSAWTNLEIFAHLYEVMDVPGQVEKYLRMLGLWDRRHDPAGSFSKCLLDLVRALPFTREVQQVEMDDGPKIVVGLDDPPSENPVVVRKLVEAGADVQFVGELRHSLEEVYLSLMDKGRAAAVPAPVAGRG